MGNCGGSPKSSSSSEKIDRLCADGASSFQIGYTLFLDHYVDEFKKIEHGSQPGIRDFLEKLEASTMVDRKGAFPQGEKFTKTEFLQRRATFFRHFMATEAGKQMVEISKKMFSDFDKNADLKISQAEAQAYIEAYAKFLDEPTTAKLFLDNRKALVKARVESNWKVDGDTEDDIARKVQESKDSKASTETVWAYTDGTSDAEVQEIKKMLKAKAVQIRSKSADHAKSFMTCFTRDLPGFDLTAEDVDALQSDAVIEQSEWIEYMWKYSSSSSWFLSIMEGSSLNASKARMTNDTLLKSWDQFMKYATA